MFKSGYRVGLFLLLFGLGLPSAAHHSRSAFDLKQTINVSGVVSEVGWTNPHYYLVVRDAQNKTWTFEGHSIPGLVRNGWQRDTFRVGDVLSVEANPSKQPEIAFGLLNSATNVAGETYHSFRPRTTAQPLEVVGSTDFSGTWRLIRSLRANLVASPGAREDWPLNKKSVTLAARFDATEDPSLRCQPRGLPRMLDWPYAQQWRWHAEGLRIEIEHAIEVRTAWLQLPAEITDEHGLGTSVVQLRGDDELLITTTGFAAKRWGLHRGLDSSANKIINERYRLIDGGRKLQLDYTVTDPEYLSAQAGETFFFAKVSDYTFAAEPACDVAAAQRHLEFQ